MQVLTLKCCDPKLNLLESSWSSTSVQILENRMMVSKISESVSEIVLLNNQFILGNKTMYMHVKCRCYHWENKNSVTVIERANCVALYLKWEKDLLLEFTTEHLINYESYEDSRRKK